MSIVINNISKYYGEQAALEDVNFTAHEGEILGLLGPNGAGKTTTMKMLSCFMPPDKGTISIYGKDIIKDTLEIRKILGYLPEHNPLYGNMYIREYLLFVASIHRISKAKDRVDELIDLTGLKREKNKIISQLSKGYRQRVGIAQAIIHKPKVLILDEPISGLDPNQIIEIRELIDSLKENTTVIFSSHILQEVESICDRIVILDKGTIVADDVISNISFGKEKILEVSVEFLNAVDLTLLKGVEEGISIEKKSNKRFLIQSNEALKIREKLFDFAVENNNKIIEMKSSRSSLESVFKTLTKTVEK